MTTIKLDTIDKVTLSIIRDAIDMALGALSDDIGIVAKTGNCSYDGEGHATFKLEVSIAGGETKEATDFVKYAGYGVIGDLKPSDLNRIVTLNGKKFSIDGYNRRARKNDIHITRLDDGQRRIINHTAIARSIAREDAK